MFGGEHLDHARSALSCIGVDAQDVGMAQLAAYESDVQQLGMADVAHEAALAPQ